MKLPSLASLGLAGAVLVSACASANTGVTGGAPRFDASVEEPTGTSPGEGGVPSCLIDAAPGAATTWTSLFNDYFGPSGAGSCSKEAGNCHGGLQEPGATASGGYVCAADKDACLASLLSSSTLLVQIPHDTSKPDDSGLVQELRRQRADGSVVGLMPKRPVCVFTAAAITRIDTWISAGAQNN